MKRKESIEGKAYNEIHRHPICFFIILRPHFEELSIYQWAPYIHPYTQPDRKENGIFIKKKKKKKKISQMKRTKRKKFFI